MLDSDSFARLYEAVYPRLVVIASALIGDRSEAADVVQQSALIAIERLDMFQSSLPEQQQMEFSRWMTVIVRNVASNTRRKMAIRRSGPLHEDHLSASEGVSGQSGEDNTIVYDARGRSLSGLEDAFDDCLADALSELSDVARICLLLKVVLNLTYEEIADTLELSPGTVASHVSRSKKSLRSNLQENAGDST